MLRGRESEQAAIDVLLDRADGGASGTLVLRGEPGIGKTVLLDYAAERAGDTMPVLLAAGIESEAELPFAGLHQLVRPVLDHLGALPEPQRLALSAAFGQTAGTTGHDDRFPTGIGDRFLAGLGALSLLAEAAPVPCLVDDAHWLDRASVDALLFTARRLHRDSIVLIFATRDYPGAFAAPGINEVALTGLDDNAADALLADRMVSLPDDHRRQLISFTRGNPLALIELAGGAAAWPAPNTVAAPMPLTSRVTNAFGHQIRALPARTRSALLIAAADDSGALSLLQRAGLEIADLQLAEEGGLISIADGVLEFRHPLIRAAAYHEATHSQRIAAHRALAAGCTTGADADRRAWHLAVATAGPDEKVAAELEQAANRAAQRNGLAAAAAGYERAALLSEFDATAAARLVLAAEAALNAGEHQHARTLAEQAAGWTDDDALTFRQLRVRAYADVHDGAMLSACQYSLAGVEAICAAEPERAVWMLMEAHQEVRQAPYDQARVAETVTRLDTLGLPDEFRQMPLAWLIRWNAAMVSGSGTTDHLPLDQVIAGLKADLRRADVRDLVTAAAGACLAGRDDAMADIAAELVAGSRSRGAIGILPAGLSQLSWSQTMLGGYREAKITATEGRRLASTSASRSGPTG